MADLLIVDDDADATSILADFLRSGGHTVAIAPDGQQGLAHLHSHRPDVVILDVEMPMLTGPEMSALMLVHDAGLEQIPIILCSGVTGLGQVALRVGTPYFLAKPYTLDALTRVVQRALVERTPPSPGPLALMR